MAPYAEKNYQKHLKDAEEWVLPDKHEEYAWKKTQKDIYDAMQSLEYEINTLFTSNGQTPFTSLGFGLGTNRFEREIQKAILNIRIKGLGSEHRTAIFRDVHALVEDFPELIQVAFGFKSNPRKIDCHNS